MTLRHSISNCYRYATLLTALFVTACGTIPKLDQDGAPRNHNVALHEIPDAEPKVEPLAKYGNPSSYEVFGVKYYPVNSSEGYRKQGIASWYGTKFHGRLTSSREPYDMFKMTAAHRTLPLPSFVKVTNLENDKSVIVRVNDRGPFHSERIIDLSYAAAARIGILKQGTGKVLVEAINPQEAFEDNDQPEPQIAAIQKAIYLQVGAFSQRENAESLQQSLQTSQIDSAIKLTQSSTVPLYRVQLGPFTNREEADVMRQQLSPYGVTESHIVTEPAVLD